ncbi:MAG: CotH kinase family protein [Duncaniella sp.]|nr:CotH kinase family protein [Duncaniella sp.]
MRLVNYLLLLLVWASLNAADYPDMYLRGNFNGWAADDNMRLSRDGDTYSITVDRLDGEFKVGTADWKYNYGSNGSLTVTGDCSFEAIPDGSNIRAEGLNGITLSYRLALDEHGDIQPSTIHISTGGANPPAPSGMSGTLPVLYINVYVPGSTVYDNEIISRNLAHKNYFDGEYWLDLNGCEWLAQEGAASIGSREEPLPLQIKARGNYTRTAFAKKPFKLKLGSKQKMLGLSKSKHFALLAHADDSFGYMRNFTGFNLGHRIGLPWTPSQQPVEVVINGDYRGLYFLTESIRIESDRVNITELADLCSDPELISGGYIVELDNYDEENQISMDEKSGVSGYRLDRLRVTWDTPEEYSALQKKFITDQFTTINNLTGSRDPALWQYLDLDDAVRYYIVEEIISHIEAYHGSTYLYRDRGEGEKWHFSPLWDCGNAFNGPVDGYFYDHSLYGCTWIPSFRVQSAFNTCLRETWKWFMSTCYAGIEDDIISYAAHIAEAAVADRRRWKDAQRPDASSTADVVNNSDINKARDRVLSRLRDKTAWLTQKWGSYAASEPEPARDATPAAPLPDYAKPSAIDEFAGDRSAATDMVTYYNLQGVKVAHPEKGRLYIRHTPSSVTKIIF